MLPQEETKLEPKKFRQIRWSVTGYRTRFAIKHQSGKDGK